MTLYDRSLFCVEWREDVTIFSDIQIIGKEVLRSVSVRAWNLVRTAMENHGICSYSRCPGRGTSRTQVRSITD